MSEQRIPLTFETGAAVSAKCLVKLDAGTVVHCTVTSTDEPIGTADYDAASGDLVAVRALSEAGTLEMKAAGAISLNANVYAAADGEIQALPAVAATYRKIGIAMEAATADGDIIEVMPYDYNSTTTVSS